MPRLRTAAAGVRVATSRRDATTTTVVAGEHGRVLLVDPAWDPDELAELADDLDAAGLVVDAGFSTHAHHDHLLWHPRFGDGPRWASPATAARAGRDRDRLVADLGPGWPDELAALVGRVEAAPAAVLDWRGPRAELIVHDAHVAGHTAVWLPEPAVLVAGDMLSDVELPLPDDDPGLTRYRAALERLAPYAARARLVVPGHGTPTSDGAGRVAADRAYLDDVMAGRPTADRRRHHPGMGEAHARVLALVRS